MKHLVTGSRGFLGTHLLRALGTDAVGVDLPECDVLSGQVEEDATIYELGEYVGDHEIETVWHLAALNDATATFYERPWDVLNVQIRGTLNVIDACVANGVKALVLFSSSEVYQVPPVTPTPEAVPFSIPDPTNPRYSYAGGKQAAELLCWHSAIERVVIVRPHNVYSAAQRPGHVVPDMIRRAKETPDGGEFAIHGSSTRSFIYIDDFTEAMLAISRHIEAQEGRVREVYHVGTEEQVSTVALAGMISRLMGRGQETPGGYRYAYRFKTYPGPAGGTPVRCPSIKKMRSIGWEPKVSLEDGLRRTIDGWRENGMACPT